MRSKRSAGLLLYRRRGGALEVFLVHPGGPFWARRDTSAWGIPKGEYGADEDALLAARREFREETGIDIGGPFLPLTPVRQPGGKLIAAWAAEGDLDPTQLRSNTFMLEWPPRSGRRQEFPEVDRGDWYGLDAARAKMIVGQRPLLEELAKLL